MYGGVPVQHMPPRRRDQLACHTARAKAKQYAVPILGEPDDKADIGFLRRAGKHLDPQGKPFGLPITDTRNVGDLAVRQRQVKKILHVRQLSSFAFFKIIATDPPRCQ